GADGEAGGLEKITLPIRIITEDDLRDDDEIRAKEELEEESEEEEGCEKEAKA
ncbi:hypothetical protein HK101_003360, partial [Irineochytrium annulatum]